MPPTTSAPLKLIRLLDYHERAAAAIRTAIELLDADASHSATARASKTINTAIVLDAMRHAAATANGNGAEPVTPKRRGPYKKHAKRTKSKIGAQRARTAKYLKQFDRDTPRAASFFRGLGPLVRRGYLAKKGDGYVLTGKSYEV